MITKINSYTNFKGYHDVISKVATNGNSCKLMLGMRLYGEDLKMFNNIRRILLPESMNNDDILTVTFVKNNNAPTRIFIDSYYLWQIID